MGWCVSEFIEVKTAELTGAALDWAVAMAEFWEADRPQDGQIRRGDVYMLVGPFRLIGLGADKFYSPSTNWVQGGPLIDECDVWLSDDERVCVASCPPHAGRFVVDGGTNLIAACRAIVTSKLGEVVQVPEKLVVVK